MRDPRPRALRGAAAGRNPRRVAAGNAGRCGGNRLSVLPAWQSRGYATAMARLLVDWARGTGRARAVIAQTTDDNLGSCAVLARLGFQQEGEGDEPGSRVHRLRFG